MGWLDYFITRDNVPKAPFVLKYESMNQQNIPGIRAIGRLPFTILDTETTGLNPKEDYILSFGAVKLNGYTIKVHTATELYLNAPVIKNEAIKVHGIIPRNEYTQLFIFAEKLLSYIGTDIIVGHHIGFDIALIEKAMKPFGLRKILNPVIDTLDLALRIEKGPYFDYQREPASYSLDQLCTRYGIEVDDRHTAAGDAFLTAQLLMKLLKIAEKKGIRTYKELMR
ncbi:3'-5' exonuclease [Anditalea andensis]|uniref:DNA polymerase III subunit alpha n=1 Tax=Anditalea andensis TaxID=1048983 RepID=A0A074KUC2_9BACT|nr:3'-5' exonuclease [Anditalea andensis]KEO73566.1 DNA polymerase III subunit alpha [Anditalea andensis]